MAVENLIPQRAPFIMVHSLVNGLPERFETEFLVLEDNIFVEDGVLREFAMIENIAQSAAIGLALFNKFGKEGPAEGFLGGISKLKVYDLPKVNDTIYTVVTLIAQIGDMFLLKGENYVNGQKLLECEVKLAGM